MYALISGCLVLKLRILRIQLTDHMKFNKKKGQNVNASIPLKAEEERELDGRGEER